MLAEGREGRRAETKRQILSVFSLLSTGEYGNTHSAARQIQNGGMDHEMRKTNGKAEGCSSGALL